MNEEKIKALVDSLSAEDQENLLKELMRRDRIAIHVENDATTHDVADIYDNSGVHSPILTILLVAK